jgi:hypothetical protein
MQIDIFELPEIKKLFKDLPESVSKVKINL